MRRSPFTKSNRRRTTVLLLASFVMGVALLNSSTSVSISKSESSTRQNTEPLQRQRKLKDKCTSCSPPGNQLIYIPLIDLPEAEGGEIVFNSRSPQTLDVTPVFYSRDGETVIADPVQIQSAEIRYVNI